MIRVYTVQCRYYYSAHSSARAARAEARRRGGTWDLAEQHDSLDHFVAARAALDAAGERTLLPDLLVPDRIHARLCRLYGTPTTLDRGEAEYWRIPALPDEAPW